jgi:hypothetical protein
VNQQEKHLIDELFGKLQQAEKQSGPRDAEAEAAIRDAVARQPAAPYYMAQAILVQENALQNLNQRVQELEQELANRPAGGGFLGGLFGGGATSSPATNRSVSGRPLGDSPAANSPATGMNPAQYGQQRGGGFMGSALQTAVAVAGGVMLANAVTGLFASEEAAAAEAAAAEAPPEDDTLRNDFGQDDGGFDDGGGFDDFGEF